METDLELTTKQSNKIKRALKALEDVRKEVELTSNQHVMWYFEAEGDVCLMEGGTHTQDVAGSANQGMIIDSFHLPCYDCGGW